MKNRTVYILLALLSIACGKTAGTEGGKDSGDGPDEEFKIPEAPLNIVETNVFTVECFLSLPSESQTSSHILASSDGKKPLVYIFNSVNYIPGQSNSIITTARSAKCYPFFIQAGATSYSGNRGTGFLTRYSISDFDGECEPAPFAGPTVKTALSSVTSISIYNCNCSSPEQLAAVVESRKHRLYADAVVVGIYGGDAAEMKEYAESKALSMRFDYTTIGGKTIYTLVQPAYVNRGFTNGSLGGVEYVKIRFEKLY